MADPKCVCMCVSFTILTALFFSFPLPIPSQKGVHHTSCLFYTIQFGQKTKKGAIFSTFLPKMWVSNSAFFQRLFF